MPKQTAKSQTLKDENPSPPKLAKKRGNSEAGHVAARWGGASGDGETELEPGWEQRQIYTAVYSQTLTARSIYK